MLFYTDHKKLYQQQSHFYVRPVSIYKLVNIELLNVENALNPLAFLSKQQRKQFVNSIGINGVRVSTSVPLFPSEQKIHISISYFSFSVREFASLFPEKKHTNGPVGKEYHNKLQEYNWKSRRAVSMSMSGLRLCISDQSPGGAYSTAPRIALRIGRVQAAPLQVYPKTRTS